MSFLSNLSPKFEQKSFLKVKTNQTWHSLSELTTDISEESTRDVAQTVKEMKAWAL